MRRRLLQNSALIFASRFLTTAISLVCVPVIVKQLGIAGYGTWETLLAIATLSAMFSGPIGGTVLWKASVACGAHDVEEVKRAVRLGIGGILMLLVAITPLVWCLRDTLVCAVNIPVELENIAAWILPILTVLMILDGISQVLAAALGGCQRMGVAALIVAGATGLNCVVAISGLLLGLGLPSILAGYGIALLTSSIALYGLLLKELGFFSLLPLVPTRGDLTTTCRYLIFLFIGSLAIALREQTDKIILAVFASPVWTGHYAIAAPSPIWCCSRAASSTCR